MARITVQDCLEQVDNRFELVLAAAQRARQLSLGAEPRLPRENDKPTVIALREIAEGMVGREVLDEPEAEVEFDTVTETGADAEAAAEEGAEARTQADTEAGEEVSTEAAAEARAESGSEPEGEPGTDETPADEPSPDDTTDH